MFQDAVESAEGYVILRCRADGTPTGRVLAFFGRTAGSRMARCIGGFDDSAEAKKACETHYEKL